MSKTDLRCDKQMIFMVQNKLSAAIHAGIGDIMAPAGNKAAEKFYFLERME